MGSEISGVEHPQVSAMTACVEIARRAGALLLECLGDAVDCQTKGDSDVVTEADRRSEAFIVRELERRFPEHGIVSEESPRRGAGSDFTWYVDPLDGTKNFVRKCPAFAVSLALERRHELIAAAVYSPANGEMFSAERGGGAFLNGGRIHVSSAARVAECLFSTGFPSRKRHRADDLRLYSSVAMATQGARRSGSSAMDLASVACGRLDFLWDIGLAPWDVAAGLLLVTEAGGIVSDLHGNRFSLSDSRHLLASNGRVHEELAGLFRRLVSE